MKFNSETSHVKRVRKADVGKSVRPGRRVRQSDLKSEAYLVQKDYKDPYSGKQYKKGDLIPNRQGRNVQLQETELGKYKSISQYNAIWGRSARVTSPPVSNQTSYREKGKRDTEALRKDPEFRKRWADVYMREGEFVKNPTKDNTKRGKMHYLLVATGVRDPNADYEVGETPDKRTKKK